MALYTRMETFDFRGEPESLMAEIRKNTCQDGSDSSLFDGEVGDSSFEVYRFARSGIFNGSLFDTNITLLKGVIQKKDNCYFLRVTYTLAWPYKLSLAGLLIMFPTLTVVALAFSTDNLQHAAILLLVGVLMILGMGLSYLALFTYNCYDYKNLLKKMLIKASNRERQDRG